MKSSRFIRLMVFKLLLSMHEKCPYSKFFSSAFSCIRTNYGDIRSIFPYSVWMRENTDQNDSNTDTFHAVYLIKKRLTLLQVTLSNTFIWCFGNNVNNLWRLSVVCPLGGAQFIIFQENKRINLNIVSLGKRNKLVLSFWCGIP